MALLRKINLWTPGVMQAWTDTFYNWEMSTKALTHFPKLKNDELPQSDAFIRMGKRRASHQPFLSISSTEHELEDQIYEWANMTGFLLAMGGVCLQRNKSPAEVRAQLMAEQGKKFGGALQYQQMPPHGASPDMQYCPVTQYLGQLLRLLVCPNEKFGASIQKHVKELVGHDMSPLLYPILFDQIKLIVEKFFDQNGQVIVNETNTQFIDHIIFIMKNVLESKPEMNQQPSENLGQTSIETMMLTIVRYVRYLDTTVLALHIKTRLCQLVETMMKRRDDLSFRQVNISKISYLLI
jgi:neurofibromin 1